MSLHPHQHPCRTRFLLALSILPLLFVAACSTGSNSRDFPDHLPISYRGGDMDPAIWESATPATTEDSLPYKSRATSWILPMTLYQRGIQFETPERIHTRAVTYNGLGIPIFLLPLRFGYSESLYTPESPSPAATQWASLTPFWATHHRADWPEDRGRVRARGIPLFFGRVDVDSDDQRIRLFNTLWSLGPAYVYFTDPEIPVQTGNASVEATVGMPLALGGLPGALLWLDAELDARNPNEDVRYSAHGPLFGLLGYTRNAMTERSQALTEEEGAPVAVIERESFFRLATMGILWMSTGTKEVGDPHSEFAAHGPLWGVFGWGKSSGRNAVRLLWLQIPVQSRASVGE